jgi:hypothetical protein
MKPTTKSILVVSIRRKEIIRISDDKQSKIAKENFVKGWLLALELESTNDILKMGVFTSMLTGTITFNLNNFIFL